MSIHELNKSSEPKCDNCCHLLGWLEYEAVSGEHDLHVSIAPGSDLDGTVRAFCHDEQEMITLNGWLFEFTSI